ncbi:hypothetical protein DMI62_01230 [Escherichia coli]|nr:hypothetical protein [Escherichia coli]
MFWLSLFHLLVITSSNYLVQLPVSILVFIPPGAFSFPFIFLATDLTCVFWRAAGSSHHLCGNDPRIADLYVISSLFYMGSWQGFGALAHFNLFVARIATASFMAYALGQILDVHVLTACVRVVTGGWHRQRPHCSVTSATRWLLLHCLLA